MVPGALGTVFTDRAPPMAMHSEGMMRTQGTDPQAPFAAQFFGGAGREYAKTHGTRPETFAKIASKARSHAANNPYAIFRDPLTVDEVMASKKIFDPLTRFQCCPPTCGAAAAVVVSERFARKHGLKGVTIVAQAMTTDTRKAFERDSMIEIVGYSMARDAADAVYEAAGVDPKDVGVVELHDCFTCNELLSYEALRLTGDGTADEFIWTGNNTYGGRVVTNPSGGLLSKGHPLGATGLAQCTELVWQLRGHADKRQVEGVKTALQHNLGLGGACVVTLYQA
jgi:acetyl-CoA acetyltransferase